MYMLWPLVLILIAEYIGDFIFQSREMALNKSKDIKTLIYHILIISIMFWPVFIGMAFAGIYLPPFTVALFIYTYCLIHGIQDWFIWKVYAYFLPSRLKKQPDWARVENGKEVRLESTPREVLNDRLYANDKLFYDFIGLDRLLHIITIVILYGVLLL